MDGPRTVLLLLQLCSDSAGNKFHQTESRVCPWDLMSLGHAAQRAKITEKVQKHPLGVNVVNFVSQTPKSYNALIEVFKFI
mgnify:FL=1